MGAGLDTAPKPKEDAILPPNSAGPSRDTLADGPSKPPKVREGCVVYKPESWDCVFSNGFQEGETESVELLSPTKRHYEELGVGIAEHFEVNHTQKVEPPVIPELRASAPIHGNSELRTELLSKSKLGSRRQLGDGVVLSVQSATGRKGCDNLSLFVTNIKLSPLLFSIDISAWEDARWLGEHETGRKQTVRAEPSQTMKVGDLEDTPGPWHGHEPQLKCEWRHMTGPGRSLSDEKFVEEHVRSQVLLMNNLGISDAKLLTASEIQTVCSDAKVQFTDVSFPPCAEAIYGANPPNTGTSYVWRRPSDIVREDSSRGRRQSGVSLFGPDGIKPGDIKQGALGDCWFLAAVAACAEEPALVKRLFADNKVNREGVYQITCYKNGIPSLVIVDDWLPCAASTGKPCFSHTHNNEIWVALLEKAWAKLHGSYAALEAGLPFQAMMDLCCKPGKCLVIETFQKVTPLDQLTQVIRSLHNSGDLLVASSGNVKASEATATAGTANKSDDRETIGLVPDHAYTILKFQEVQDETLVCLRNPWGNFEWKGEWGDSSLRWTPEAQTQANHEPDEHDGVFWMNEKEFYSHFRNVHVLHRREMGGAPWSAMRHPVPLIGNLGNEETLVSVVQLEITASFVDGFCTLWQPDVKMQGTEPYCKMAFAIYGPVDKSSCREQIRSHCWAKRELVVSVPKLKKGTYWVAIWNMDVKRAKPGQSAQFYAHLAQPANVVPLGEASTKAASKALLNALSIMDENDVEHMVFTSKTVNLAHQPDVVGFIKGGVALGKVKARRFEDHGQFLLSAAWGPDGNYGIAVCSKPDAPPRLKVLVDFTGSEGLAIWPSRAALMLSNSVEVVLRAQDGWCPVATLVPQQTPQIVRYRIHWACSS